jgi:thiol-disulfide isomerase/thioredoxin
VSNRPNTKARPRPAIAATPDRRIWQSPIWWVGFLLVVAVIVTIALTSGGGDSTASSATETAPAEAIGTPLPRFETMTDAAGLIAPSIAASTIDGTRVQVLNDGTPRLYGFFAHWCPHCQREVPRTVAWLAQHDLPVGVELVAISTSVDPTLDNYPPSAWFEREGWPLPVLVDSETGTLAKAFGLSGFPFWVAVDAEGKVVARQSGELDSAQFEALLDAAATGQISVG